MLPSNMLQSPRRHHCQDQCAPIWWSALWEREIASSSFWISDSIVLFRKATCSLMYQQGWSISFLGALFCWMKAWECGCEHEPDLEHTPTDLLQKIESTCTKQSSDLHRTANCSYLGLGIYVACSYRQYVIHHCKLQCEQDISKLMGHYICP